MPKYTKKEYLANLLQKRTKKVPDELGLFTCCVPFGRGVTTWKSGYKGLNFKGKPTSAHSLVHSLKDQYDDDMDTSHLCGNTSCCNPHHLWSEPHQYNLSRRGYIGYMRLNGNLFSSCKHEPRCKTTAMMVQVDQPKSDKCWVCDAPEDEEKSGVDARNAIELSNDKETE